MLTLGTFPSRLRWAAAALVVGAVIAGGVATVRAQTAGSPTIKACANRNSGQLRILAEGETCRNTEVPLSWNVQGPKGDKGDKGDPGAQGPPGQAGAFSGTVVSPNGRFSLSVTDAGIELKGPLASVRLTAAEATVSGVTVTLNAATVALGCTGAGGGLPVARLSDLVLVDPTSGVGTVQAGSLIVRAC